MRTYRDLYESEKKRKLETVRRTVIFLGKTGNVFGNQRFLSFFNERNARFNWATEKLFQRLEGDLIFQIRQAMPRDLRRASRREQFKELSQRCHSLVEWFLENNPDLKVTKKQRAFSVPKGESFGVAVYDYYSRKEHACLSKNTVGDFYLWNAIDSLIVYLRARDTLQFSTGNDAFEKILKGLSEEYMLAGYPQDILSHDAVSVRQKKPIEGIIMNEEYASTWCMLEGDEVPTSIEGRKFVPFKKARQLNAA